MTMLSTLSLTPDEKGLEWRGNGEYLRIEAWGQDSVRVRSRWMQPISDNLPQALLSKDEASQVLAQAQPHVSIEGHNATLSNGNLVVRIEENYGRGQMDEPTSSCRIFFETADGKPLFAEASSGGALNLHARSFRSHLGGDFTLEASFDTPAAEHLYGMGEYQNPVLDLKGSALELAHRNSQASIPFVVSSQGYGFLWNNPAIGRVSFAKNNTLWQAQSTKQLDYWVTAPQASDNLSVYAQIESRYADVTGHAPHMPEWGLGFWQCKLRYYNQKQVLDVACGFKERNIPIDVIIIDFFHWPHMGDFRFEEEFFPDVKSMCEQLHSMGIKVMVSVWPQVGWDSENYAELKAKNLLVGTERGVNMGMAFEGPSQFYDATNAEARQYVWDKCRENYAELGIDGFWLDEAEPEFQDYNFDNYRYSTGPVAQVGNTYPRDFNRGFYEGQLAMGREGEIVNLTRCAWAGSQRYASLVWSGDVRSSFADLRAQITCAIHMGMAGIPWFTTDMGGFHSGNIDDPDFRELYCRWAQFSCFSAVMRNHGDRGGRNADGSWRRIEVHAADGSRRSPSGVENEPWAMGETVEKVLRKFIGIRELLRPYTRELFEQASATGAPLVRGLFFEFPHDSQVADIADEYLYGSDLLVAPITTLGARSREVYLPEGASWTDLASGTVYDGGQTISVPAEIDTVPLFARDGRDHGLLGKL